MWGILASSSMELKGARRASSASFASVALRIVLGAAVLLGGSALRDTSRLPPSGHPLTERPASVLPPPPSSAPRDGALVVRLRDEGGAPLRGRVRALLMVEGVAHRSAEGITDERGTVRWEGLPRGDHWVLADADGHARGTSHLVLGAVADQGEREVELVLGEGHRLDVTVRDDLGAPLPTAEIEVRGGDPLPLGALAGDDGIAHATRLSPGPWTVNVRAPGYEEVILRGVREGEGPSVVLRRLGTLLVDVTDAAGEPAVGAQVFIAGARLWPARVTSVDAAGRARIGGLASGTYALRGIRGGEVSPVEVGVSLGRGEDKSLTLHLQAGLFVATRVVAADGAEGTVGIEGARVTLVEQGLSPFPLEGRTDKGGRARLGPIVAGEAALSVQADGFVARSAVEVPQPPPSELLVTLVRGGVLEGRVMDGRGVPVDGATLEVIGTDFNGGPIAEDPRRTRVREAHFDLAVQGARPLVPAGELGVLPGPLPPVPRAFAVANPLKGLMGTGAVGGGVPAAEPWVSARDGTFRLAPVPPGRVRVLVRHPQYVDGLSEVVTLNEAGTARVDVTLVGGGFLEGRVTDEGGRPAAGARVTVSAVRGSYDRTTRTATDGTFAFAAVPEAVVLTVSASDDEGAASTRLAVTVPEGGRRVVALALPASRPSLDARVVDDRGYPVAAAQISAASLQADAPVRATAFTDARGECRLAGARGLPLRVEVRAPGFSPLHATLDAARERLDVTLTPGGKATGEVRALREGTPIPRAEVTLYTETGPRHARTDAKGEFTFDDLAGGPAKLLVSAVGFGTTTVSVSLPPPDRLRPARLPRVELAPEAIVEGVVVDERGEGVAGARVAVDRAPTYVAQGPTPRDLAVTGPRGTFRLGALAAPAGTVTLEAYAPDVGTGRVTDVRVGAGDVTSSVRIVLRGGGSASAAARDAARATGGVAVTLGELAPSELADAADPKVVVVAVAPGTEAEHAGLAPGDILVTVDGTAVPTMEAARSRLSGSVGDDVLVTLRRGARTETLRVPREPVRR